MSRNHTTGPPSCRILVAFRCLRAFRFVANQWLALRQISRLATRNFGILGAKCLILFGWGTWIRTRTNGVRVRGSTVNLFPSAAAISNRLAGRRVEHECFSPSGQGPLPIWCRLLSYSPRRSIPRDDQLPRIESVILSMEFTGRAAAVSWFRPPRRYSGYRRRVRKRHEPPFHVGKHDRDRKKAPEAA